MTASKKFTIKSAKSPAPATKTNPAKTAAKKKRVAPLPAKLESVAPAPAVVPVAAPAPAVVPVSGKPVVTTITAQIDVGFGNELYLRGEGPGLSWDRGWKMDCVGDDQWETKLGESVRGFAFKFLVNDLTWSAGPDYTIASGESVTLTPEF